MEGRGGWIECYDVLRRVVATKTMRLVTVIVHSVRLRAVTNRVVSILRFNPPLPASSSSFLSLFRSLLLLPRVMKRSFVLVLLFTPATNYADTLFFFFKLVPPRKQCCTLPPPLPPPMLRIYDLHSVGFAYARFMSGTNTNKNLSKPKCLTNCTHTHTKRCYFNFIIKQYRSMFFFLFFRKSFYNFYKTRINQLQQRSE